jgi:hypothetical protein
MRGGNFVRPVSFRAFFERGCLASWMVLLVIDTVIIGLAIELFVFGTICSFNNILLINEHTAPLLLFGVFATIAFPLVMKFWEYGVENLNFEIHEAAMNRWVEPPESWSTVILALLDETALRSHQLALLVRLIDEAPGPVERQDRRAEAKAWLKENRGQLSDEDKEFVKERLGYLH